MDNKTSSPLPPLYARWFDDLLSGEIPAETSATCHDCAMCDTDGEQQTSGRTLFNPQSKCCTYLPELPNFLVGMILADDDPTMATGRTTVEARLKAGLAVTPLGLQKSTKLKLLYQQMEVRAFGRAQILRCPHYISEQGGLCGVWKYRNSICSTWFCKYVRGATGRDFWETAKLLLLNIEGDLSRWCAVQLELDDTALELLMAPPPESGLQRTLTPEDLDDLVDLDKQRKRWGNWYGREREFFLACAELVAPLEWSEVLAICGSQAKARARLTQKSYQRMTSSQVPERLRIGGFTVTEANNEYYSLYSPGMGAGGFRVSSRVMRLLPYFDGRPTSETVSNVVEKEGLRFTDELLMRLVDFKILVST